ncbi:S26 family signal peptidase [Marinivivus vitaminiproducens]|uniref:S26 family signal peptidase n=1 Tax=Marinivivus vitaminiproducens TaxID=3035935 RepID=UPI0027AA58B3|nr:S26 family signal peptidase [Geminicoccaceae bacterium SCSIO 64248]
MITRLLGRILIAMAIVLTLAYGAHALGMPRLVLWEMGTSMPRGLYVYAHGTPIERGETIVLDEAPNWGRSYLMKRIEGLPGQTYCWDEARQAHRLDDRWMPEISITARMMEIPVWRGCRQLGPDEYVGYGAGDSYDSRYIGPVSADAIAGAYRLVVASP